MLFSRVLGRQGFGAVGFRQVATSYGSEETDWGCLGLGV